MRVLVIENDANKLRHLVLYLTTVFADVEVIERYSYQSGLKSALLEAFDIILLDMTMPTFDVGGKEKGGRERRYAGVQVLKQMQRKGVKCRVIIVTQFERFGEGTELVTLVELKHDLAAQFPENYVGTVFYQAADVRWMDELTKLIKLSVPDGTMGRVNES